MKPRILVWGMTDNRAGTEKVVANATTALADYVDFDFLVFEDVVAWPEIHAQGNRQFVIPNKRTSYPAYKRAIKEFFEQHASEYAAAWVNINIPNNVDVLTLAKEHGIPVRIAHAHNSANDGRLHHKVLSHLNRKKPVQDSTARWACSQDAGAYLYRGEAFVQIPNAIDCDSVAFSSEKRAAVREKLGIDGETLVVGNVGRLSHQKNQEFLIKAFAALHAKQPDSLLVIVGRGELEDELRALADSLHVTDAVVFAGVRSDMQAWLSAFDVFAFPSHFEGASLALIEAQSNGLPCVTSTNIIDEVVFDDQMLECVPIENPDAWVRPLLDAWNRGRADAIMVPERYTFDGYRNLLLKELEVAGVELETRQ